MVSGQFLIQVASFVTEITDLTSGLILFNNTYRFQTDYDRFDSFWDSF